MFKTVLGIGIVIFLLSAPKTWALTQNQDQIGVIIYETMSQEAPLVKSWQRLQLNQSTRTQLLKQNQALDQELDGYEKYRIAFLFLVSDQVSRVAFYGNRGSVVMMDWPTGNLCRLNFEGQGGYAGIHKQACRE